MEARRLLMTDSLPVIVRHVVINGRPAADALTDPQRRGTLRCLRCLRAGDPAGAQSHLEKFFETVEGEFRRARGARDGVAPS